MIREIQPTGCSNCTLSAYRPSSDWSLWHFGRVQDLFQYELKRRIVCVCPRCCSTAVYDIDRRRGRQLIKSIGFNLHYSALCNLLYISDTRDCWLFLLLLQVRGGIWSNGCYRLKHFWCTFISNLVREISVYGCCGGDVVNDYTSSIVDSAWCSSSSLRCC